MRIPALVLSIVVLTVRLADSVSAGTVWDEAVNGDLSTDPNAPKLVFFNLGSNVVTGTITSSTPADARDYITFTIPTGQALAQLRQLEYVDGSTGGSGNTGFHAMIAGSSSFVPSAANIGSFLGSNHLNQTAVGADMLPDLANALTGGTGFTIPLRAGAYTYHVQQTGENVSRYSLDFVVVPEPGATLLLACAGLPLAARRHRK